LYQRGAEVIMANNIWKKTKEDVSAPPQYVQTTDTVSRPAAVMMTLVMVFIGFAVIFSIFLAGRWLIGGDNNEVSTPTPSGEQLGNSTTSNGGVTVTPTQPGQVTTDSNQNRATNDSTTQNQNSNASSQQTSSSTQTPTTGSLSADTVPNTGPSTLPNTGPQPE
jgi:hypothetical protein